VALGAVYRKARNGDLLASKRVPLVLAMEDHQGEPGRPRSMGEIRELIGKDEFGKSALGRIASG